MNKLLMTAAVLAALAAPTCADATADDLGQCFALPRDYNGYMNVLDQFACASKVLRDKCGVPPPASNIAHIPQSEAGRCIMRALGAYEIAKREAAQQQTQKLENERLAKQQAKEQEHAAKRQYFMEKAKEWAANNGASGIRQMISARLLLAGLRIFSNEDDSSE